MYRNIFKRGFDVVVAFSILLLVSPILLLITVLLAVYNDGQPFYFQKRPGYLNKPFYVIKFKSMTDQKDEKGELLPDKDRITALGKFLRSSSLDELPQLLNVLKGDMSLVGPRPLLFKYLPLYTEKQRRRHEVRPGITGLAQVNGRNSISWTQKFEYDINYVDNISFLLDLKIIWLTFLKVIKREGVNQSEHRPMQPFNGNN